MRVRFAALLLLSIVPASRLLAQSPQLDSLDAFIEEQMARRRIPGLSVAVVQSGRVVVARSYGVSDRDSRAPVTPATLFQAGSISKPVAALAALHLVETGKLRLDEDVNTSLLSWKLPENGFTRTEKVTLRRLLSHRAGVTVHGFPGYAVGEPVPALVQVLNGSAPANTAPIRVDTVPGAMWRYSGGGFTIVQQLMEDVTGTPFPRLLQEIVLGPLGMTSSSFEQPLPPSRVRATASGYYADRAPVPGRWHLYPEMAAAGLWTTPSDLARFVIEIQATMAGRGHRVISPAMARAFLNDLASGYGLGVSVEGDGLALRFTHGGRDEGFDAFLHADLAGNGIIIMINANDNARLMGRIMDYVARTSGWPEAVWGWMAPPVPEQHISLGADRLSRFAGYYLAGDRLVPFILSHDGQGIAEARDGLPDETFRPIDGSLFSSVDRALHIGFVADSNGGMAMVWKPGTAGEQRIPRVIPLPSLIGPAPDPDSSLSAQSLAALDAIRRSGRSLELAPGITPGAKHDFATGIGSLLDDLGTPVFLGEADLPGHALRRHGSPVARVRYYRVARQDGPRFLLVYLAEDNRLTDFEVLEQ